MRGRGGEGEEVAKWTSGKVDGCAMGEEVVKWTSGKVDGCAVIFVGPRSELGLMRRRGGLGGGFV